MAKRKKYKKGICVFCKIDGDVTDDHIPPKYLFKGYPDNELIKVPACEKCNGGSKLDDEYFVAFLIAQEDVASNTQAQKLNRKLREKFDTTDLKGLEYRMYSQLHSKDLYTPAGIYLGRRGFIYPQYNRIDGSLKKIIKGLFFHLMKTPFPSKKFHLAVVDITQVDDLQRHINIDLNFWMKELAKRPILPEYQNNAIYDTFSFKCAVSVNTLPVISVWLLNFFGKRQFFGITYPKIIGNEIELIDADPDEIACIRL